MAKKKRALPIPISPHAQRFIKLLELKPNWNSYGAPAIDFDAAQAADLFLNKQVNIVPTSKGGIQLEWHVNGLDIEIEFDKKGIVGALVAYDRK